MQELKKTKTHTQLLSRCMAREKETKRTDWVDTLSFALQRKVDQWMPGTSSPIRGAKVTIFMSLGGNAVRGRKMVPLNPDVFPSNKGILFCALRIVVSL